ncbi:MAG TPA: type I-C CRISPR-associated protein Cas8c/Csd1 [Clostridiales bacterium]|nr:type I-C CRISPR-associated protein Cas8c/Csd1 [Clostridiales bacterium]
MGIMQAAYRTYEAQAHRAGKVEEKDKEPLTPLSHAIQNAQIEIVISNEGEFIKAYSVTKDQSKTVIPVTIESANRTSKPYAHPLCDQLMYLAPYGEEKFSLYVDQLEQWASSEFSHPKVRAVFAYIKGKTIVRDLAESGVITLDEEGKPSNGKIEGSEYSKCLTRWQIIPAPEGGSSACWEDSTLFDSYIAFYAYKLASARKDICFVTGWEDVVCDMHPKGIVAANYGAKLASANDNSGFTYRGRFTEAWQAYCIGYTASQKAHHALRWITSNQGVTFGNRTFICWNPEGAKVPSIKFLDMPSDESADFISYKKQLRQTLSGYRHALPETSDVVIAAFDTATTGRLSVTYYNELKASDFLNRIEDWYASLCWKSKRSGVYSPTFRQIVECAFGVQRGNYLEADERILPERIQQLLHCMIDRQPIPFDVVQALVSKASTPLAYNSENRELLLTTTCAVIRKYRNEKYKEEWTLALDTANRNRSYLFGRLLAVAEQVERSASDYEEGRETNAIRMQSVFAQRPLYGWRILEEKLNPYFARLSPGLRNYFKNIISEIVDMLPGLNDPSLGKKLEDTYLLGYYHQRSALKRKKDTSVKEENDNESAEE